VKAHQDDKQPYEELDIWGRMNCDADKLAEKFQKLMDEGKGESFERRVLY
jgi:hypothetical protein